MFIEMFLELLALIGSLICLGIVIIIGGFLLIIASIFIKNIIGIFKGKTNKKGD